jgi:hypothetical protein
MTQGRLYGQEARELVPALVSVGVQLQCLRQVRGLKPCPLVDEVLSQWPPQPDAPTKRSVW